MVFFQTILLMGYVYAHLLTQKMTTIRQIWIHTSLIVLALLTLPITLSTNTFPELTKSPVVWQLGVLALTIGLPFFILSATAPLLQKWYSHTTNAKSKDPYFLYAASNLGSILALLAYPVLLEPLLQLRSQSLLWSGGFLLFFGLVVLIAVVTKFDKTVIEQSTQFNSNHNNTINISWRKRSHWVLLAFIPSSLMLSVTTHISLDITPMPLLWVIPLTLYLLSFVIVFRTKGTQHLWIWEKLQVYLILVLLTMFFVSANLPLWLKLLIHILPFFVISVVCHGALAETRPSANKLTEFYICMSIGGAAGGIFNALIAPVLFNTLFEYPIILILACLARRTAISNTAKELKRDFAYPAIFAIALILLLWLMANGPKEFYINQYLIFVFAIAAFLVFSFSTRPLRFGLSVAALMFNMMMVQHQSGDETIYQSRGFFGIHQVKLYTEDNLHVLKHGSTVHGAQSIIREEFTTPLTYYNFNSPPSQILEKLKSNSTSINVGLVGLGTGALLCHKQPEDVWTVFEIDAEVVQIASNTNLFNYLDKCASDSDIVVGDARLTLSKAQKHHFDVIILDAFSSDAIPTHLITREAFEMYEEKLKPKGVLLIHISNRYIDLKPVLSAASNSLELILRVQDYTPVNFSTRDLPSQWAILSSSSHTIDQLTDQRWKEIPITNDFNTWTDDYSNILSVVSWRKQANNSLDHSQN